MVNEIITMGALAYHFGNAVSMLDMLKKFPSDYLVMGNIDPASQFRNGTPDSVSKATRDLLEECGGYSNFVISSGCVTYRLCQNGKI